MDKYNIAGLNVSAEFNYDRMKKNMPKYKKDFDGDADITISVDKQDAIDIQDGNPHLTLGACEYMLAGTQFYKGGIFQCNRNAKLIGIHDGARPLITEDVILRCAKGARSNRACIPGIPPTDTIKQIDVKHEVERTVPREKTRLIQTPQIFDASLIKGALTKAINEGWTITDDASAVEIMGINIHVVDGSQENIKLTSPIDFYVAEKILENRGVE